MTDSELVEFAKKAMRNSYSPYSNFKVGAALLTTNGNVFTSCNVENSAFSPTICAERTAFVKAISEGYKNFESIAVVAQKNNIDTEYCSPCGVCRQFMSEFCSGSFKIILVGKNNSLKIKTLEQLLPNGFGSENLEV